jgi:AraC family transcriptional regulator
MRRNSYRLRFDARVLDDQDIAALHAMESEVGNFFLTESRYPPGMEVPTHSHENASFYLILSGNMTETCGNVTRELGCSTLVFTPPGEAHSNRIKETGCRLFTFETKANWLASIRQYYRLPTFTTHSNGGLAIGLARRAYSEARHLDVLSPLVVEGLALELLAEICRQQVRVEQKRAPWLEKAREMLHARSATKLTISQVAKEVGVHPVYLASAFRRHYGCTLGEYSRRVRIEYACTLLRTSRLPLAEIALAAGFHDQSHFSRTLKLMTGMTATEYRASASTTN